MATTLTDSTTYTGKDLAGFYSTALLTGDTKSVIRLIPDVKSKAKLASLNLSNILSADGCSFADSGTATLAQRTLEVCSLRVNLEFCERDFEVNYLSEQLRAGSNKGQIPASFQDYILQEVATNISAATELLLWQGDTGASPADLCDGFLTLFAADSGIAEVAVVSGGLTAANIIAELGRLYAAIPCTISGNGKVVMFLPCSAVKFYKQALAALGNTFATYNTGNFDLNYIGVKIIESKGLPDNVMVAAEPNNLWFGTDLMSDLSDVTLIPQRNISGASTVRFITEFKFGVQYGVSSEIVWYN